MHKYLFSILIALCFLGCNIKSSGPGGKFSPTYSPDGSQLAYYEYIDGVPEIMVYSFNESKSSQITPQSGAWSIVPRWNPKGDKLMFSHGQSMMTLDVAIFDLKTKEMSRFERFGTEFSVNWFDSSHIWANRSLTGTTFYKSSNSNPNTYESIEVSGFSDYWIYPINENGEMLLHVKDENAFGLYHYKIDSEPTLILKEEEIRNVSISRDHKYIAFEKTENENTDIYMANLDGSELMRLTTNEYPDYMPEFSPDGSSIVFSSARTGVYDLYVIDLASREISILIK